MTEAFGDLPLDRVSREMVGQWLIEMSRHRSAKTVKNVHNLASSIMADAIQAGLISANPFRGAVGSLPKVKHEEMGFLTRAEFEVLSKCFTDDYRPLVRTLAFTGLRWSEATALRVRDVEVDARRLSVVRAWKRTPESYFVIGEPKSVRSRRRITIPKGLAADLGPLAAGRGEEELLFTSPHGRPVRHANFRQRVWLPALEAMQQRGVPKRPRIHDLRHSHASWLIAAGVPLPAIQRRLGHESITTTIDRYGHLAPELDDAISAALDGSPDGDQIDI
jgi:integrase